MKIETKYEIGAHIWLVYGHNGEVNVSDDYIDEITINPDKELVYYAREACEGLCEDDIVLYEDTEALVNRIIKVMDGIRESEK